MNARRIALWLIAALVSFQAPVCADDGERQPSSVARNANFLITAPEPQLADDVLAEAERLRDEIASKWLGEKLPPSVGMAMIHVRLSQTKDQGLSLVADGAGRLSHQVWLTTSRGRAVGTTLAHELTHVVLATRYPGQLPAWANEGAASFCDDRERHETRRSVLAWYANTGNWPRLRSVLEAEAISPLDQAKYAVAASVTRYLLDRSEKDRFLEFCVAGRRGGWDAALLQYYEIADVATLESDWQNWVQGGTPAATRSAKTARRANARLVSRSASGRPINATD